MKKTTAHIIFGCFDIAAVGACYHVYHTWVSVHKMLLEGVQQVTIQIPTGLYLLTVLVALVHLMSLVQWSGKKKNWMNYGLVISLVLLTVMCLSFDVILQKHILNAGYRYCVEKSESMTFSKFKTFVNYKE